MAEHGGLRLRRHPQSKAVDAVRWLPAAAAFDRLVAASAHDPSAASASASTVEIHSLSPPPSSAPGPSSPHLHLRFSWPSPSRIAALRASPAPLPVTAAASTLAGSLHLLLVDAVEGSVHSELSIAGDPSFHDGAIPALDLQNGGRDCVTAGEDGRINIVTVSDATLAYRRVHCSQGLASYTAARWASPAEFTTGALGLGVQWWDQRKPGSSVAQFKGSWGKGSVTGMVHSIDIHPSRKHVCVVGGSSGTVFAWDIRWRQQPVSLSGFGLTGTAHPVSESEVWEVQYDTDSLSGIGSASSTRILPVMMCSEDGILAVVEQGEDPVELLAEPCAINAFDIDPQNPSDVICALEWESIGLLMRGREATTLY